jgi:hypothetical protein
LRLDAWLGLPGLGPTAVPPRFRLSLGRWVCARPSRGGIMLSRNRKSEKPRRERTKRKQPQGRSEMHRRTRGERKESEKNGGRATPWYESCDDGLDTTFRRDRTAAVTVRVSSREPRRGKAVYTPACRAGVRLPSAVPCADPWRTLGVTAVTSDVRLKSSRRRAGSKRVHPIPASHCEMYRTA